MNLHAHSFLYISPPCQRTATLGKTQNKNIHMNNAHLYTSGHCSKQNTHFIWKEGESAPYPYVSPPQSKKQTTAGKTQMKTYPVNNEHQRTVDTAKKHENPTIYGKKASQHPIHIAWQVHVCKPK
jgi:hypothetical protein